MVKIPASPAFVSNFLSSLTLLQASLLRYPSAVMDFLDLLVERLLCHVLVRLSRALVGVAATAALVRLHVDHHHRRVGYEQAPRSPSGSRTTLR